MAKQQSILKFKGTIGDLTFYKSRYGFLIRRKTDLSAERVKTSPAFQRTRENAAEFGRAAKAARLFRYAFRNVLQSAADSRLTGRLTREMLRVIRTDEMNVRGNRNVANGALDLLEGFDCNIDAKMASALHTLYTTTIDRESGQLVIDLPSFIPVNSVAAPAGTTHFRIISAGAEIDFQEADCITDQQESAILSWDAHAGPSVSLQNHVTANSIQPLFLLLGISFFQSVNGKMYSLNNGAYNALSVVKVL